MPCWMAVLTRCLEIPGATATRELRSTQLRTNSPKIPAR